MKRHVLVTSIYRLLGKEINRAQETLTKARKQKSKAHNDETLVGNSLRTKRTLLSGTSGQVLLQKDLVGVQKELVAAAARHAAPVQVDITSRVVHLQKI